MKKNKYRRGGTFTSKHPIIRSESTGYDRGLSGYSVDGPYDWSRTGNFDYSWCCSGNRSQCRSLSKYLGPRGLIF